MNWTNVTVKLSDLQPWEHNPRTMTKRQAQRLLKSWKDLGQFQTIAIGPHGEVYDGHQRLSALMTAFGAAYQIEARQCERELSEDERRYLITQANLPVGAWNFEEIAGWPEAQEWGFDAEMLKTWNADAGNLRMLINGDDPPLNPLDEWQGMPEYGNEPKAFRTIHVHFESLEDVQNFADFIGQSIGDKTSYIWYPEKEKDTPKDFVYSDES
jgi:hypothetical protein